MVSHCVLLVRGSAGWKRGQSHSAGRGSALTCPAQEMALFAHTHAPMHLSVYVCMYRHTKSRTLCWRRSTAGEWLADWERNAKYFDSSRCAPKRKNAHLSLSLFFPLSGDAHAHSEGLVGISKVCVLSTVMRLATSSSHSFWCVCVAGSVRAALCALQGLR